MNWLNTNFPNWRSSLIGLAVAVAYAAHGYLLEGTVHKSTMLVAVLIAALGYIVKDKAVTGGSVPQTLEAAGRAEKINPPKDATVLDTKPVSNRVPRYPGSQPR